MSLFAAYSSQNEETNKEGNAEKDWLINSSFNIIPLSSNEKDNNKPGKSHTTVQPTVFKNVEKRKHKKKKTQQLEDDENFTIERTGHKEYFKVKTISRPAVAKYRVKYYITKDKKFMKRKFKRYYQSILFSAADESKEQQKLTRADLDKPIHKELSLTGESFVGFKEEEDLSKTTAKYNRLLTDNPHDIEVWLKYVSFQDVKFQFEKYNYKGSHAKALRVKAERQLSILDKALANNPKCDKLFREYLRIASATYPADELHSFLEKLVRKDQGNIILWQGLIESRQCSMSHCTAPTVLKLYTDCLSILHKLRRNAQLERHVLEESILRMLYQCGLFLKQAGLFEQLWTLLSLYLELNLFQNRFDINVNIDEKQLEEYEETVLKSNLPLHELWLRIEKLRECFHFLPVSLNTDDTEKDPQRIVFPNDVSELIHPITTPGNNFKLTATILTLLKIPLLPCRHYTMKKLGIDYVPWSLDSVECLLPVFFSMYGIDATNQYLLKYTQRLAVGPQYLKNLPCKEEYLQFVLEVTKCCADSLNGNGKIAMTVWWFRFMRLLVKLGKTEEYTTSNSFKKTLKTNVKILLGKEENRTNVMFFVEYALLEYEQGHVENARNVLFKVIALNFHNKSIADVKEEEEKAKMSLVYRTLIEITVNNSKDECIKFLICFALGKDVNDLQKVDAKLINEAAIKFKHLHLLNDLDNLQSNLSIEEHFLPNYFTDFIICYGWFLYLTEGAVKCGVMLENTITALNNKYDELVWCEEIIYEFYVSIMYRNCLDSCGMFKLLNEVLYRAIERCSNNIFLLSILLKKQSINCTFGQPWWKMTGIILKTGHALPILFLILIANEKMVSAEEKFIDTISGKIFNVCYTNEIN